MIIVVVIIIVGFIIYMTYDKWKKAHPEIVQAKRQAQELEEWLEAAKYQANAHDGVRELEKHQEELRRDLKAYIVASDSHNPMKLDLANMSGSSNANVCLAIIFYYLGDMPNILKKKGLVASIEKKKELLQELIKMELNQCYLGHSAKKICEIAFEKNEEKSSEQKIEQ